MQNLHQSDDQTLIINCLDDGITQITTDDVIHDHDDVRARDDSVMLWIWGCKPFGNCN